MRKLIVKCAIIITMMIALNMSLLFIPIPAENLHYIATNIDKQNLLQDHDNGTIILVGGSHGAFSYDTQALQESLNRPVINMALHAGLGLRFILDSTLAHIQEDDVVLLILEHGHYLQTPNGRNSDLLRRMLSTDYQNTAPHINHPEQVYSVAEYHPEYTLQTIWRTYANNYMGYCSDSTYCRSSFNPLGDINSNFQRSTNETQQALRTRLTLSHDYTQYNQLHQGATNLINRFNEQVNQRGATVYIIMPPLPATIMNNSPDNLQQFANIIDTAINIEVINAPYGIPDFLYYDTIYHLNDIGKDVNTRYMASFIQSAMTP